MSTVRVSILNIPAEHLEQCAEWMTEAEESLAGIRELPGLISYHAGIDRENNQLSNVSVWDSAEHAKAMSSFQPMLDLGAKFLQLPGISFVRPIPNFDELWRWD
jgi:quinol monooxygenase YgiN